MTTEEIAARRAIERFEEEKAKLYRRDGSKRHSDAEHGERLAGLTAGLTREMEALIEGAETEAARREASSSRDSYTDPTRNLTRTELERLTALRPLVAEDCERLPVEELAGRLQALAAAEQDERVAKILHARYGAFRVRALAEPLDAAARGERALPEAFAAEQGARLRELQEAVGLLEEHLADPAVAERRERASNAARERRELAGRLRRLLAEADGTDAAVGEEAKQRVHAVL